MVDTALYPSPRRPMSAGEYVDAAPVRDHLRALHAAGLGRRRVAELTGLASHVLATVLCGNPRRNQDPPSTVPASLARRISSLEPDPYLCADTALLPAVGTHRRLQALVRHGWSLNRLARELGVVRKTLEYLLGNSQVHARTARAVRELYDRLWNRTPPTGTRHERRAVTLARTMAAARDWRPALAWDDDTIDNPAAEPQDGVTTAEPVPDSLAISLLYAQQRRFGQLAVVDRRAAIAELTEQDMSASEISRRLRIRASTVRSYQNSSKTPHPRIDSLTVKRYSVIPAKRRTDVEDARSTMSPANTNPPPPIPPTSDVVLPDTCERCGADPVHGIGGPATEARLCQDCADDPALTTDAAEVRS